MSVVSAIITRYGTAHASDSLLCERCPNGTSIPTEWKKSKIVPVPKLRGAMAYWGLATHGNWNTYEWLKNQATRAKDFESAEEYSNFIRNEINNAFSEIDFQRPLDAGIGIHFTAYEYINQCWIPELFLITNFTNTSYSALHPDGIHMSRQTYGTMMTYLGRSHVPPRIEQSTAECRFAVYQHLQEGGILTYNNGDPIMYNNAAMGISSMLRALASRGNLVRPSDLEIYRQMVRTPIEIVAQIQSNFAREGTRLVGGKIHDLFITPNGDYSSSSGD